MAARVCMLALAGLVAGLLAAPTATARPCGDAAPADSEVDQYSEFVPGACGEQPSGSGGGGDQIPAATAEELGGLGPDGEAAAALAEANAGGPGAGERAEGGRSDRTGGDGDAGAIVDVLGGSGEGMGFVLPLILALVAAAGIAYAVGRRRGQAA